MPSFLLLWLRQGFISEVGSSSIWSHCGEGYLCFLSWPSSQSLTESSPLCGSVSWGRIVLLLSLCKSSLGKACSHFICDILLGVWASRGGEEGKLDSLAATGDVWHWKSEMARREKNSLSVSVWPCIIWNGNRRQGRLVVLMVQWQELSWWVSKNIYLLVSIKQDFL